MSEGIPVQAAKGKLAGRIVLRCLADGSKFLLRNREELDAWSEMHSVAHMWAATTSLHPETDGDPLSIMAMMLGEDLARFLLLSERILDQMQSREDLKHPDPWRLSPVERAHLEATYGPDA